MCHGLRVLSRNAKNGGFPAEPSVFESTSPVCVVKIEPLPPVAVSPVAQATFARHQLRLEIPTSNRWGAQERRAGCHMSCFRRSPR